MRQQTDEFDPAAAFDLQPSQDATDGLSDEPPALFPAPTPTKAAARRQRPARTQAQLDSPMALALELAQQIRTADWDGGPAPVNAAALARNLSAWRRDGTTADQIRWMITRYVHDPSMRTTNGKAPWIDFISKRHKLLAQSVRATQAQATEDARHADDSYWLGSMAGER
jgi:hypothetical protein